MPTCDSPLRPGSHPTCTHMGHEPSEGVKSQEKNGLYFSCPPALLLQDIGLRVRRLAMQDTEHVLHGHDRLALDALVGA